MKVDVKVDTDNLHKKTVDKQGRVYLGRDYVGKNVELALVEIEDTDTDTDTDE